MKKLSIICDPALLLMQTASGEKFIIYPNSQRFRVVGNKQRFKQCLMCDLFSTNPMDIVAAKHIITIMEHFTEIEREV